jgi:hypothetical protein
MFYPGRNGTQPNLRRPSCVEIYIVCDVTLVSGLLPSTLLNLYFILPSDDFVKLFHLCEPQPTVLEPAAVLSSPLMAPLAGT